MKKHEVKTGPHAWHGYFNGNDQQGEPARPIRMKNTFTEY